MEFIKTENAILSIKNYTLFYVKHDYELGIIDLWCFPGKDEGGDRFELIDTSMYINYAEISVMEMNKMAERLEDKLWNAIKQCKNSVDLSNVDPE